MTIENWLMFCAIALVGTATPGQAMLLVTYHSARYGVLKSIATIVGNITGLLIMSSVSVAGLSVLILNSSIAFSIIKFAGAAYLIYFGIDLLLSLPAKANQYLRQENKSTYKGLYFQGVFVALTNPKAIIFTTALFPQFLVESVPLMNQFPVLLITFMGLSFICLLFYSLLARKLSKKITNSHTSKKLNRLSGGLFIGAGVLLASTSRS